MRRLTFALVFAFAAILSIGGGVLAQGVDASWLGTWKLNLARSKFDPASRAPKSTTFTAEAAGDSVKTVVDLVDAQGKSLHEESTYKYDGKEYAYKGESNASHTHMYTRIDDHTYQYVTKIGGKVMNKTTGVFSPDFKTRTLTSTGTNAHGETMHNITVFEKQ